MDRGIRPYPATKPSWPPEAKPRIVTTKPSLLGTMKITTLILAESSEFTQASREGLMRNTIKRASYSDVILFPAGYFDAGTDPVTPLTERIVEQAVQELNAQDSNAVVVLGLDGDNGDEQIAVAVNREGVVGKARKFFPTEAEKGVISLAEGFMANEGGYRRIIEVKGRKLYLAVCYDVFGIKKRSLPNPGVHGVLNLIHGFNPPGEAGSGEVYFTKHGLAGAAKQWRCPVFGSAVFIDRDAPERWPSGVAWNSGDITAQRWRYEDNPLRPHSERVYRHKLGCSYLREFEVFLCD